MLKNLNGNKKKKQKGISTIEILIIVALLAVTLTTLLGLVAFSLRIIQLTKQDVLAEKLVQDTLEAVRNFRDQTDWEEDGLGVLSENTAYYPQKTGTPEQWTLITGEEAINGFTRKVVFEKVNRDSNDNISSSGVEDPNSLKVIATVSWDEKEIEIATYLTNWNQ